MHKLAGLPKRRQIQFNALIFGRCRGKPRAVSEPPVEWDFIYLSIGGFGVAVNHKAGHRGKTNATGIRAGVFITTNPSLHWLKNSLRLSLNSRMRSMFSWPVEQFHSLAVTRNRTVMLAWEDPWIMEQSRTHIIYSNHHIVYSHIQQATFVTEQRGFALLARYIKSSAMARPETIILLTTDNAGLHWRGVAEFPFPGESPWGNPRQVLALKVA